MAECFFLLLSVSNKVNARTGVCFFWRSTPSGALGIVPSVGLLKGVLPSVFFFTTFFEAKAFAPVFGVYEGLCIYLPIAATHGWLVAKHLRFQHTVYKNQGGNPSGVYLYTFPPPSCNPGGDLVPRVRARAAAHADDHEGRGLRRHQRGRVGRRRAPVAVHGELVLPQAYRGPGKRR